MSVLKKINMYKITNKYNNKAIVRNNKETLAYIRFLKRNHYDISIFEIERI